VPPAAEVKLLRSMQQSIARRTRALDESLGSIEPVQKTQMLGELAARQARILELGSKLAEKIRGGGPGPSVTPGARPDGDVDQRDRGIEEERP
jgi:hypothetical protein